MLDSDPLRRAAGAERSAVSEEVQPTAGAGKKRKSNHFRKKLTFYYKHDPSVENNCMAVSEIVYLFVR